jgi:hypothetical protein
MLRALVLDPNGSDDWFETALADLYSVFALAKVFVNAGHVLLGTAAIAFALAREVADLVGCAHCF